MKVFLAATSDKSFIPNITDSKYILESFYYFQEWQVPLIKKSEMFLLDSGAFTFMSGKKSNDFDGYLTQYIDFIRKHDVEYFFELDIDSVVGYEKVKQLRKRLEQETGKKCIPVWHKSRGKDEFLKMCDEYDYVAIGGIVTKEITKDQYPFFTWFLNEAHKRGCKVHGLGFTSIADLPKYHFDSVDSTSWKSGGRFGQLHIYKNGTIKTITQKSKRAVYRAIDTNNFNEWLKYQRYADKNL
jgi:hypothetical protein